MQWKQEKLANKNTTVLDDKILQIGPLPERGGLLKPTLCEAFWGQVKYQDGLPIGLSDDDENTDMVETVTRLSRGKEGALLFRYDNFRTTSFLFGSNIRTGIINSAYEKLEPMRHALFAWEIDRETLPRPNAVAERDAILPAEQMATPQIAKSVQPDVQQIAHLPAVLVDLQEYAMGELPAGASITHFKLDEPSPQNTVLGISIKGKTNSNQEVSDLLRAMMRHAQVENVELVSVQQTPENKIEFQIRLKLKTQTQ